MEPDRRKTLIAALSSSDEEERRRSMEELKGDITEGDLAWLVGPLSDESWRVRKEAIEGLKACAPTQELVAAMIPMMDPSRELTLRNSIVEVLEGMGREVTPFLTMHLHVDQPDTRKFLVDILGNIGDVSTIPPIVELLGDQEDNIRAAASEALASIGDPTVTDALMAAIPGSDEWVIFSLLGALDKLRCTEALPMFFQYLDNQLLAKPSLSGIGNLGSTADGVMLMEMVPALSRGAAKASLLAVGTIYRRHAAAGQFAETTALRQAAASAAEEGMVDFLIEQLSVSDQLEKRQSLLAVLGMIGSEKAIQAILQFVDDDALEWDVSLALLTVGTADLTLIKKLLDHFDPLVRRNAVQILEQVGGPGSLPALYEKLDDESGHVRKDAAKAISTIGDSSSITRLLPLLQDEYSDVAQAAAQALIVIGQKAPGQLSSALVPLQTNADPVFRALLLRIMTEVQTPEWQEMCLSATHDEDSAVRAAAISCLKRSTDPNAVRAVINSLADERPEVRVQAAISLETLKAGEALAPLKAALHDHDPWVRTAAISSLSVQPGAVPEDLEDLLTGNDLMMQTSVVDALGQMAGSGKPGAIGMLERVFDEGTVETRRSVCHILGRVSDSRAYDLIVKAVHDEDPSIRTFAAHALGQQGGEDAAEILRKMAQSDPDRNVRDSVRNIVEA
ncbi:MAG: HEAT repeat domain-containing protein [bacterium]|nr:HEAT repeat domain-containing protein [bacterium]